MTRPTKVATCLLLGLTFSCGSASSDSGAPRNAAGAGRGSGGETADASGGFSASSGTSGGGSSAGSGGTKGGVGGTGGSSTGGASGSSAGISNGGTSGTSTGGDSGTSTGGSATGGSAGTASCARWMTDAWRPLPSTNAPSAREEPWVIPTDDGMLVFGGYNLGTSDAEPFLDDGAIYDACDDSWTSMSTTGVPHAITDTVAQRPLGLWTGDGLLVWGGFQSASGGYEEGASVSFATRYSATKDAWSDMKRDGEPTARDYLAQLWTGNKLLVWGGIAQSGDKSWVNHNDGALYDPKTDSWATISTAGAPSGRYATGRVVWTGTQLIVWGGLSYGTGMNYDPVVTSLDDGGVYDAASDKWTPIASAGAPHGGLTGLAWTGKELIVVSKLDGYTMPGQILFEGARFDPAANAWTAIRAPSLDVAAGFEFVSFQIYWLGSVLAVFGETVGQGAAAQTLLLYDPETDSWSSESAPSTPPQVTSQSATVVGTKLVVAGSGAGSSDARGAHHESTAIAVFDGKARAWLGVPDALNRSLPSVAVLSDRLLVWGGKDIYTDLDAPNPCQGSTGACDPVTPTIQTLLADGVGITY